ncbi:MAG: putative peroxiredoxin [Chloroflexota bacterium]|jgi:peroxiredoxin
MAGGPTVRHQPDDPETAAARQDWFRHYASGPTRTRWTELPPQAGDRVPDLELVEARSGRPTRLSTRWAAGPAILLFWRHYGCSCGRDRAKRLAEELPAYLAAGASVAIVGQGELERTRVYAAANAIPDEVAIFCDPDELAYRAFGILEAGPIEIFFDAPDEYLRCDQEAGRAIAAARADAGMPLVDNTWLMPAEFVVDRGGTFRYVYRYQFCENWPDPRVLVAAARFSTGDLAVGR